ncbi:MAG TPA: hypothetical protein VGU20_20875 [Stellaceae bacterium]|nr:hypothetical protein [Stellaceae bacterium]
MRNLTYAMLMLTCLVPAFATSANADDASTANTRSNLSPSDQYFIDSRSGGDAGQEVDQFPGASVPSAESQMPADDSHWQAMSGSSVPPSARPLASSSTKTPDWLSNPTGPLFK